MEATDVFRENVRAEMKRAGITATQLAEMIGTSSPNISRILGGTENVTIARADRIARALHQPLARLLIESPDFANQELQPA